jgi:hypothetical protein
MSENILYTADGRRIEFDMPDQALDTIEEMVDMGAGVEIAITHATPTILAAELTQLHTVLGQMLQDAPAANFEENDYAAGFQAGLDEAKKLVQARIAELGGER